MGQYHVSLLFVLGVLSASPAFAGVSACPTLEGTYYCKGLRTGDVKMTFQQTIVGSHTHYRVTEFFVDTEQEHTVDLVAPSVRTQGNEVHRNYCANNPLHGLTFYDETTTKAEGYDILLRTSFSRDSSGSLNYVIQMKFGVAGKTDTYLCNPTTNLFE